MVRGRSLLAAQKKMMFSMEKEHVLIHNEPNSPSIPLSTHTRPHQTLLDSITSNFETRAKAQINPSHRNHSTYSTNQNACIDLEPSSKIPTSDPTIDELSKNLRNITNHIDRLKSDSNVPAQPPPRNYAGYKIPYNPQSFQRDSRTKEQNITTPLRKDINNVVDEE